jgi:hypothetical protein
MTFQPRTFEHQHDCIHPAAMVVVRANVECKRTYNRGIVCNGSIKVTCHECGLSYEMPVSEQDYDLAAAMDRAVEMFLQFSAAMRG